MLRELEYTKKYTLPLCGFGVSEMPPVVSYVSWHHTLYGTRNGLEETHRSWWNRVFGTLMGIHNHAEDYVLHKLLLKTCVRKKRLGAVSRPRRQTSTNAMQTWNSQFGPLPIQDFFVWSHSRLNMVCAISQNSELWSLFYSSTFSFISIWNTIPNTRDTLT